LAQGVAVAGDNHAPLPVERSCAFLHGEGRKRNSADLARLRMWAKALKM
jgi:hypothetical protein